MKPYTDVWQKMRNFTDERIETTTDEMWIVEHPAVFTLGQAGKEEHLLATGDIPVVRSDRGGQVTYHGPGQLIIYLLIDVKRMNLGIRDLVSGIENAVIKLLAGHDIKADTVRGAPGVYVNDAKIAALGLRIRKGKSYHGLSMNVDMDLTPYARINPCGYEGLEVTDLVRIGVAEPMETVAAQLVALLAEEFGYDAPPRGQVKDVE